MYLYVLKTYFLTVHVPVLLDTVVALVRLCYVLLYTISIWWALIGVRPQQWNVSTFQRREEAGQWQLVVGGEVIRRGTHTHSEVAIQLTVLNYTQYTQ